MPRGYERKADSTLPTTIAAAIPAEHSSSDCAGMGVCRATQNEISPSSMLTFTTCTLVVANVEYLNPVYLLMMVFSVLIAGSKGYTH